MTPEIEGLSKIDEIRARLAQGYTQEQYLHEWTTADIARLRMDAKRLLAELDRLPVELIPFQTTAVEYGIDAQTMLTLAKSQIETAKENVRLREAQRWIPTSERLPDASEYRNGNRFKSMDSNELVPFLVCCEDTEIPFRAFYDGKNWGDGWGKREVTHWRKLPEPPQKG